MSASALEVTLDSDTSHEDYQRYLEALLEKIEKATLHARLRYEGDIKENLESLASAAEELLEWPIRELGW